MSRTKRILSIVMSILLLLPLTLQAMAEEYDTSNATKFTFSDTGISVSEGSYTGYKVSGTDLTINSSGTYVVSGECADGSITVKKGTEGVVLVMDGLTLTSSDTAPLSCNKSTTVTIVVKNTNTLKDSTINNDDTYPNNENAENAVIKCKDGSKVTITGNGTLNVISNGKNAIKSGSTTEEEGEAYLTIQEATLNITANVNDAINAEATLNVLSGNLTITAVDDALHSDYTLNIGASNTSGPTIQVKACEEGLEGATVNIYSGNISITGNDDGINAANSDLSNYAFSLNIYGGTILVNVTGDGIDSNGTLNIAGGKVTVFSSSQNDNSPYDCDGTFTLTGGEILGIGSSGMAQSPATTSQAYVVFGANSGNMRPMGQMTDAETNRGPGGGGGNTSTLNIKAGDAIVIKDSSGNTLASTTAVRTASYVIYSSPSVKDGETYTLALNGTTAATSTASTQGGQGGQPGQPGGPGQPSQPGQPGTTPVFGFYEENGKKYWYENGTRQGVYGDPKNIWDTTYGNLERGREIYDPATDAWYWLDAVNNGAAAYGKEVWMPYIYQNEDTMTDSEKLENANKADAGMEDYIYQCMVNKEGKWVRYDENGKMIKGWVTIEGTLATLYPEQAGNTYYYDTMTGAMAKGYLTIDGVQYHFDELTGALIK